MRRDDLAAIRAIRAIARPLRSDRLDFDPLLERIGDARVVLLGAATHGTHEFHAARARITERLIVERGFTAVAVEAEWPGACRVNRYVRGESEDAGADQALSGFRHFPTWMWRNRDVLAFVEWLHAHNLGLVRSGSRRPRALAAVPRSSGVFAGGTDATAGAGMAGFFGLDLYGRHGSIAAVLDCLDRVDPAAARRARDRYACFDHFGHESQAHGYATGPGLGESWHRELIHQLVAMRQIDGRHPDSAGGPARDDPFFAEQNALLVGHAEEYYRSMFEGDVASWNRGDSHMAETLGHLVDYLDRGGARSKVVVWAHNAHLGDARATDMGRQGGFNLGQLARQRFGADMVNVGFTTHVGTVSAASDWDGPRETKMVRPSLEGSWERLFHDTGLEDFLIDLGEPGLAAALAKPRLERAIGVIYRPHSERQSHYFEADLPRQFDVLVHYDRTQALRALPDWQDATDEPPAMRPSAV